MDPEIECGVNATYMFPAILGATTLVFYLVIPNGILYNKVLTNVDGDQDRRFRVKYGWAVEDFKDEDEGSVVTRGWEVFNTCVRTAVLAASVTMYEENRFYTQTITMSISLALHVCFRPYKDDIRT